MAGSDGDPDWTPPLLPSENHDSLAEADCLSKTQWEPLCYYDLSFVVMGVVTALLSIWAIVVVYRQLRTFRALRMLIITMGLGICLLVALHYAFFSGWRIAIIIQSLVLMQYFAICYFFWRVLIRMGTVQAGYTKYFKVTMGLLSLAEVGLVAYVLAQGTIDCQSVPWLILATFQLLLAIFYLVAIKCMLQRMKMMRYTELNIGEYQRKKKRQLWFLLFINIFSSMAGVAYEIVNVASVVDGVQCEAFFQQATTAVNLLIRGGVRTVYIFLPVWSAMVVFWHWPNSGDGSSMIDSKARPLQPVQAPERPRLSPLSPSAGASTPPGWILAVAGRNRSWSGPDPDLAASSPSLSTNEWDQEVVGTNDDIWAFRLPDAGTPPPILRTPIKMKRTLPNIKETSVL